MRRGGANKQSKCGQSAHQKDNRRRDNAERLSQETRDKETRAARLAASAKEVEKGCQPVARLEGPSPRVQ
jgi:hypothetical protein